MTRLLHRLVDLDDGMDGEGEKNMTLLEELACAPTTYLMAPPVPQKKLGKEGEGNEGRKEDSIFPSFEEWCQIHFDLSSGSAMAEQAQNLLEAYDGGEKRFMGYQKYKRERGGG